MHQYKVNNFLPDRSDNEIADVVEALANRLRLEYPNTAFGSRRSDLGYDGGDEDDSAGVGRVSAAGESSCVLLSQADLYYDKPVMVQK